MEPEQVHLSLGANDTEMYVTWVTQKRPSISRLTYRIKGGMTGEDREVNGQVTEFGAGWMRTPYRTIQVHRATMTHLIPDTRYEYKVTCGSSPTSVSQTFTFRSPGKRYPVIAVYGDMGLENAVSLPSLKSGVVRESIDAVFHIGDIAYDLMKREGKQGDDFMVMMEPLTSRVPYQVLPGNHESTNSFEHYENLFTMIDSGSGLQNNFFYSTNIGPMHIVCITTEFYYQRRQYRCHAAEQYAWLRQDLRDADRKENRSLRPWILVMSHHPMYSSFDPNHYGSQMELLRVGFDYKNRGRNNCGLEDLFHEFHVDVYFSGHIHVYERTLPVYRYAAPVCPHITNDLYSDPRNTVYVVTGVAGSLYNNRRFVGQPPKWSAFRCSEYGYTLVKPGSQCLHIEQVDVHSGNILDEFTIQKTSAAMSSDTAEVIQSISDTSCNTPPAFSTNRSSSCLRMTREATPVKPTVRLSSLRDGPPISNASSSLSSPASLPLISYLSIAAGKAVAASSPNETRGGSTKKQSKPVIPFQQSVTSNASRNQNYEREKREPAAGRDGRGRCGTSNHQKRGGRESTQKNCIQPESNAFTKIAATLLPQSGKQPSGTSSTCSTQ